ncbi:MAG: hypothetical protein Q4C25_05930, partial [Bacillota bacterium]|nr:hypothetical protein [Bacillota bacterium]
MQGIHDESCSNNKDGSCKHLQGQHDEDCGYKEATPCNYKAADDTQDTVKIQEQAGVSDNARVLTRNAASNDMVLTQTDPFAKAKVLLDKAECHVSMTTANTAADVAKWLKDTWLPGINGLDKALPADTNLEIAYSEGTFKAATSGKNGTDGEMIFSVVVPGSNTTDEPQFICENKKCTIVGPLALETTVDYTTTVNVTHEDGTPLPTNVYMTEDSHETTLDEISKLLEATGVTVDDPNRIETENISTDDRKFTVKTDDGTQDVSIGDIVTIEGNKCVVSCLSIRGMRGETDYGIHPAKGDTIQEIVFSTLDGKGDAYAYENVNNAMSSGSVEALLFHPEEKSVVINGATWYENGYVHLNGVGQVHYIYDADNNAAGYYIK